MPKVIQIEIGAKYEEAVRHFTEAHSNQVPNQVHSNKLSMKEQSQLR